jgi:short-subunit dehydrogenase
MTYVGKNFWIIGASSGIGEALAVELAGRGARLALSARSGAALKSLTGRLGAQHLALPADVTRIEDIQRAMSEIQESFGRIDGVIILSAVYTPMPIADMKMDVAAEIVTINLIGTLNCVSTVLPVMRAQRGGQIALCGSVAGYRGLPNAQPYGATKAAIINFAESLRLEESSNGLDVRIINPGFVSTPMTKKNSFPMPMIITPEEAAGSLADQLAGNSFEIDFPRKFTRIMKFLRILPDAVYFPIARRFK